MVNSIHVIYISLNHDSAKENDIQLDEVGVLAVNPSYVFFKTCFNRTVR